MTYDQEFAEAMKLKLDLNRKAKAKASSQGTEASAAPRGLYDRTEEVNKRDSRTGSGGDGLLVLTPDTLTQRLYGAANI